MRKKIFRVERHPEDQHPGKADGHVRVTGEVEADLYLAPQKFPAPEKIYSLFELHSEINSNIIKDEVRLYGNKYDVGVKGMNVSRVSPRGQVVIPKHLRDKFNIKPNSKVYFTESDGKLVLHILPPDPVAAARGILQKDIPLDELIRQNREEELSFEKEFQNR